MCDSIRRNIRKSEIKSLPKQDLEDLIDFGTFDSYHLSQHVNPQEPYTLQDLLARQRELAAVR